MFFQSNIVKAQDAFVIVCSITSSPSPPLPPPSPPPQAPADRLIRKNVGLGAIAESLATPTASTDAKADTEISMARRSLRWLHKRGLKHYTVPLAILCTTLLKLAIGTGSYSGEYGCIHV